jgi:hypothetical protein
MSEAAQDANEEEASSEDRHTNQRSEREQREAPSVRPRADRPETASRENRITHHGAAKNEQGEKGDEVRHDD